MDIPNTDLNPQELRRLDTSARQILEYVRDDLTERGLGAGYEQIVDAVQDERYVDWLLHGDLGDPDAGQPIAATSCIEVEAARVLAILQLWRRQGEPMRVVRTIQEVSMSDEHPQHLAARLDAARQEIMERYPAAADEIAVTPIPDEAALERVERFAAAWAIRRERAVEAREQARQLAQAAGRPGSEAAWAARQREEHRARAEYGLDYRADVYTLPGLAPEEGESHE